MIIYNYNSYKIYTVTCTSCHIIHDSKDPSHQSLCWHCRSRGLVEGRRTAEFRSLRERQSRIHVSAGEDWVMWKWERKKMEEWYPIYLPGGNSNILKFSSLFGAMIRFDSYFWKGLKPPTRYGIVMHTVLGFNDQLHWQSLVKMCDFHNDYVAFHESIPSQFCDASADVAGPERKQSSDVGRPMFWVNSAGRSFGNATYQSTKMSALPT